MSFWARFFVLDRPFPLLSCAVLIENEVVFRSPSFAQDRWRLDRARNKRFPLSLIYLNCQPSNRDSSHFVRVLNSPSSDDRRNITYRRFVNVPLNDSLDAPDLYFCVSFRGASGGPRNLFFIFMFLPQGWLEPFFSVGPVKFWPEKRPKHIFAIEIFFLYWWKYQNYKIRFIYYYRVSFTRFTD